LFIDWYGSAGGEICVYAINNCGESEVLCEQILISPGPSADFTAPDTLCLTDLAEINYTGTASPGADYFWGFSGGVDTSGNNDQGAGPYVLTWATTGPKVITLMVEENGCVSTTEQKTLVLQPPLKEPLVNCNSNQSEITFSWNDVANASGYAIDLVQGNPGDQIGNTYVVTGLNPLDSVSIVVTALSETYCPSVSTHTITCFALDCPDVTLDIFTEDTTICYTGGGTPFILDHLITPDDIGILSWSGDGIIDPLTGLFHPDTAGFGSHQIRISYVVDNCTFVDEATINILEEPTADFTVSEDSICNTEQLIITYTGNLPNGNPTWEFSNPTTITGQNLNPRTATWETGGWKTISLQVELDGCESELETKMVYVEEALPDIDIDCATSVDSVVFTWPQNAMIEGYQIYVNGSLVDSSLIHDWTVDGLMEGDIVELYLVGINTGICANPTGIQECQAEACPNFGLDVTPAIDTICLVDGIGTIQFESNLTGSTIAGEESWTGNGIDPNSGLFDPVAAGSGNHLITFRYAEGSCDIDTSFTITVLEQPVADFTVDQTTLCITDAVTLTNNQFNNNFDYNWGFDNANINQLSDEVFELAWDTPGTYDLSLQVSNFICESEEQVQTVVVEPELIAPVISCDASTQSISLNWTQVDCAAAYQLFIDGTLVTETTDNQFMLDDLASSQTYQIEMVVISECACPDISTSLECTTLDCEDIELSIDELPLAVCRDEISGSISLHATIVGTQGGDITWSGNNISPSGDAGLVDLDQFAAGEYYFTLEYDLNNCHYEFSDVLTIYPEVLLESSATDPSCHDLTDGSIELVASQGTGPFVYLLNGVQQDSNLIQGLGAGNYNLEITDFNGCRTDGSVSLNNPSLLNPSISGLEVLQENQSGTYTLNFETVPADASYTWYFSSGEPICNENCGESIEIRIEEQQEICVDVSYNDGACLESACMTVRFEEIVDVYIPNVFSPNNDDQNDVFFIKSDESVTLVKSMNIFDRWGELIFNRSNFAPNESDLGWDGKFNGKSLMPGVYVYDIVVLTTENKEYRYTGDITLIR
jgi:gliding motility-associated-like protein